MLASEDGGSAVKDIKKPSVTQLSKHVNARCKLGIIVAALPGHNICQVELTRDERTIMHERGTARKRLVAVP